jgi:CBS domain-containing protein
MKTVADLMSPTPVTCRPDDDLATAAGRMRTHDHGALPVVDPDGYIAAMITDRDVCVAASIHARPLRELLVSSAMSSAVHTVRPSDALPDAMLVMKNHQLRRLPVVEHGGKLVGMITLGDLARAAGREGGGVTCEAVVATLAEIARPRSEAEMATQPHSATGTKRTLRDRVYDLMALRDSIRVRLHLAGMDARDRFHELEPKVEKLEHELVDVAESASERVEELLDRLTSSLRSVDRDTPQGR